MNLNENKNVVALGDFDGMHIAHKSVVKDDENVIIYSVNNRFSLLQKSIFERRYPNTIFADFEKIKNFSGKEFMDEILIKHFNAKRVHCGFNFRFGKGASYSANDMKEYLEQKGIEVSILPSQLFDGLPISSTRIRKAVQNGDMTLASKMLGYNFTFESEVVKGDMRGRQIGFPTINQHLPKELIVPKFGVYESRVYIDDKQYKAFTNIGIRPTFMLKEPMSETHIFDFSGDLYGKIITVELVKYIRPEKEFKDVNELKRQLIYDKSSII